MDWSGLYPRFNNDETGASAYDPRVMLKIMLLAYSRGQLSSRSIERARAQNVPFMALSGTPNPAIRTLRSSFASWGEQIEPLFAQVLLADLLACRDDADRPL